MERKNLEAGKNVARELAPDPIEHTPEAPIISEEEAQMIENPDGAGPEPRSDERAPNDIRRQAGNSGHRDDQGIRITPEDT